MSSGHSYASSCYSSGVEAAQAWCSAQSVLTRDGALVTCAGVSTVAPDGSFTWTRRTVDGSGLAADVVVPGGLVPPCEHYDWAYWAPIAGAFAGALVAIYAARYVISLFTRDQDLS